MLACGGNVSLISDTAVLENSIRKTLYKTKKQPRILLFFVRIRGDCFVKAIPHKNCVQSILRRGLFIFGCGGVQHFGDGLLKAVDVGELAVNGSKAHIGDRVDIL